MAGTTEFHPGYHGTPCAFPEALEVESRWRMLDLSPFGFYPSASQYELGRDDPKYKAARERADGILDDITRKQHGIPEHFDRTCPNCKHTWAERVA